MFSIIALRLLIVFKQMYLGEYNMLCKTCNKEKKKIPVIRGTITRFIDENNKFWNGKQCSDCYRLYNKERMKKARQNPAVKGD